MIPTYNPVDFENLDLRKYHIRTLKDVQRFIDFTMARLDEANHIVKKVANENSTLKSIASQMTKQQEKINKMYGSPYNNDAIVKATQGDSSQAKIESVEDKAVQEERDALLDEMRQAVANDSVTARDEEDQDEKLTAELDKYKLVVGRARNGEEKLYWFRDKEKADGAFFKQLTKETNVPEEIRHQLLHMVGRE